VVSKIDDIEFYTSKQNTDLSTLKADLNVKLNKVACKSVSRVSSVSVLGMSLRLGREVVLKIRWCVCAIIVRKKIQLICVFVK